MVMFESKQQSPLYNLHKIRSQASQSIESGAVTQDYGLDLPQACQLLNTALATEIMCVMRYLHHHVIAKGIDRPQIAAEFKEHAKDEQRHMMMIAERINQLGGNPDFNPGVVAQQADT